MAATTPINVFERSSEFTATTFQGVGSVGRGSQAVAVLSSAAGGIRVARAVKRCRRRDDSISARGMMTGARPRGTVGAVVVRGLQLRGRWPTADGVDLAVAAVLVVAAFALPQGAAARPVALVAGAVGVATVALRRRWPAAACCVLLGALTLNSAVAGSSLVVAPLAIALDYYMLGRRGWDSRLRSIDAGLIVVPLGIIALGPNVGGLVDVVTPWFFFGVVPFGAGRLVGKHESSTRLLDERVAQLEREQREHERRLAAVERGRIARDLHDVVGHNVSVMVIQAVAARRVAELDPLAAREALGRIAATGRAALAEIRELTGALRHPVHDAGAEPAMGRLDNIGVLVERASAAGLSVALAIDGSPYRLPAGIDLAAFRLVQEALTNVIKHAGQATATVRVAYREDAVAIEVTDDGGGGTPPETQIGPGGQSGIAGMRERVAFYGGDLHSGTRTGGGFIVNAQIPIPRGADA